MRAARMNVGIFIFDDVEVLDFAGPYEVFSRTRLEPGTESRRSGDGAPFEVFTIARTAEPVVATGGLTIVPQREFADYPIIDLLVVSGGWGTRRLLDDPATLDWLRRTAAGAQRVTSVCTGSLLLARAGLLAGKSATTHWGAVDVLAGLDPTIRVEGEKRVVDDGIVTAAGISAGVDMALYIVKDLLGSEIARDTARYMDYRGEWDVAAPRL